MNINFEEITENMRKIQEKWKKPEQTEPPVEDNSKSIDEEVTDELLNSKYSMITIFGNILTYKKK